MSGPASGGGDDDRGAPAPGRRKRGPSPYADKPYDVGKGKPPKHSQFKAGQRPPAKSGRPKGSTKASSLQRLLAKTIMVNDADGRRVRKTFDELIDHKLVELAAKGDLDAIKLIKHLDIQMRRFGLIDQPTEAEIRTKIAEEEELRKAREEYSRTITELLEFIAEHKRAGLLEYHNGRPCLMSWIYEEGRKREEAAPKLGPSDPSTWGA